MLLLEAVRNWVYPHGGLSKLRREFESCSSRWRGGECWSREIGSTLKNYSELSKLSPLLRAAALQAGEGESVGGVEKGESEMGVNRGGGRMVVLTPTPSHATWQQPDPIFHSTVATIPPHIALATYLHKPSLKTCSSTSSP